MQMYNIIEKKRDGGTLSDAEIAFFIQGITKGTIPDYQTAALLMAVFIQGMNERETLTLTMEMAKSGDMLPRQADIVDKHSTGGVGDTTTLILLPLCMAAGTKIAKLSGRGLGFTGGTIDKLESIPSFRTNLSAAEFAKNVTTLGAALSAQTGNIAPADKILYALRDVTATVDSLPLIAASIMSKKLASGAGTLILDVKCGAGAFMKTTENANALARLMVKIGCGAGLQTKALITRMDAPLGDAIGNALEVMEAIEVLKGKKGPLYEVSLSLASLMTDTTPEKLESLIQSGAALDAFAKFITAQGGNADVLLDFSLFKRAKHSLPVHLSAPGFICSIDGSAIGSAACLLGAGRTKKEDEINPAAGIRMHKKVGDRADGLFCTLYTDKADVLSEAEARVRRSITLSSEKINPPGIIIDTLE